MTVEDVAHVAYEANRAYGERVGDTPSLPFDVVRESIINGIWFHIENPLANPIDSHDNWMKDKLRDGWKYGPVKDAAKKEHPCMLPYHELPPEHRIKDALFIGIVRALHPAAPGHVDLVARR